MKKDEENSHKESHQKDLECWFQTALGRSLLANQRSVISSIIQPYFGVFQAEIGVSHRVPVGNPSSITHKYFIMPEWSSDLPSNVLISESDEIALDTGSVDLVILHHTLDFAKDPHQTLREASRVLKSTGHLVIIGFNPTSLWGLRKVFNRSKQAPWNSRYISGKRISDWLNLLHYQVSDVAYHYYGLPFNKIRLLKKLLWLGNLLNPKVPLGTYYIMSAQKQTFSRVQKKQRWNSPSKAVGLSLSSSRNVYRLNRKNDPKHSISDKNS